MTCSPPVIVRGEQATACRHQWLGEVRHADEGIAGNIHRGQKSLP
jgi:hypothetical protein